MNHIYAEILFMVYIICTQSSGKMDYLVMGSGTRKPETRLFCYPNPKTDTRTKPDLQNPKTRGFFGFHNFPPNPLTFTPQVPQKP